MLKQLVCGVAVLGMAITNAFAQARIIDSEPVGNSSSSSSARDRTQSTSQSAPVPLAQMDSQSELYAQMQLLQQEVQDLRGIVEQQQNDLKRIKQQRLDDYVDIDRRLSQLTGSAPNGASPGGSNPDQNADALNSTADSDADTNPTSEATSTPNTKGVNSTDELNSYRSAIDLVLKKKDFDGGINGLKGYLRQFPGGLYAANSQFWLGQIYLQKEDLAQSKKWFELMIKDNPSHQKIPEVKFKLGKVYHSLGENDKAKAMLKQSAATNDPVASQARDYLKANF